MTRMRILFHHRETKSSNQYKSTTYQDVSTWFNLYFYLKPGQNYSKHSSDVSACFSTKTHIFDTPINTPRTPLAMLCFPGR